MVSKKSYFNLTIFRNNVSRFWPIWAGYLFLLIMCGPFSLFMGNANKLFTNKNDFLQSLASTMNVMASPIIISIFVVLSAMAVFAYQYSQRSAFAIHALPIQRAGLFLTNYVSGLLFLIIPQFINYILISLITIGTDVKFVDNLLPWFASCVFVTIFLYSIMVMFCMFSGNFFWPPILYLIFNLLYIAMKYMIFGLGHFLLYGIPAKEFWSSQKDFLLSPLYYLIKSHSFSLVENMTSHLEIVVKTTSFYLPYTFATIAIIGFAFLLYKKRSLECVGNVLSYKSMRPPFLWLASTCFLVLSVELLISIFFSADLYLQDQSFRIIFIFVLAFSVLVFFLTEMIIKKKFRIFSKSKAMEAFIFTALMLIALCAIRYDIFHLESKLPDLNNISSATVNYYYKSTFTTKEEIAFARNLHSQLLQEKHQKGNPYTDKIQEVSIVYHLKKGPTLTRNYRFYVNDKEFKDKNSILYKADELYNNTNRIKELIGFTNLDLINPYTVSLYTPLNDEDGDDSTQPELAGTDPFIPFPEIAASNIIPLMQAYIQDLEEGNIKAYYYDLTPALKSHFYTTYITFNYGLTKQNSEEAEFDHYFNEYSMWVSSYTTPTTAEYNLQVRITKDCVHTIKALEENGIDIDKFVFEKETIKN